MIENNCLGGLARVDQLQPGEVIIPRVPSENEEIQVHNFDTAHIAAMGKVSLRVEIEGDSGTTQRLTVSREDGEPFQIKFYGDLGRNPGELILAEAATSLTIQRDQTDRWCVENEQKLSDSEKMGLYFFFALVVGQGIRRQSA